MTKQVLLGACVAAWSGVALAGPTPDWCKGKRDANSEDLRRVATATDAETLVPTIAEILCTPDASMDGQRADVEKARQAWAKKLGMSDADWNDALAYEDEHHNIKHDLSANKLDALTPIDQYSAIHEGFRTADGYDASDPVYTTDALGTKLTETGRLAFLEYCLKNDNVVDETGNAAKWAVCQDDVDKFDANKVFAEIHGDTAHDGSTKMVVRMHALAMPAQLKELADKKAKLVKGDDTYQKVYDIAAKGRADWQKNLGGNTSLIDLVFAMDSAVWFHSRKQLDGCETKTTAALQAAVSKIPAKAFTGMFDVRDDPYGGFGAKAGPILINYPEVYLAGIAYAECQPIKGGIGDYLAAFMQWLPGMRGPRSAAISALAETEFKFDDTRKGGKLQLPPYNTRPYGRSGGSIGSAGGIVKSVKNEKDVAVVAIQPTKVVQEDCVKEHRSNRIMGIRPDGSLEYELICDKTAMVTHDNTWTDFKVSTGTAKWLKAGALFSTLYGGADKGSDVLAVWPSKNAKLPSLVLGAPVK